MNEWMNEWPCITSGIVECVGIKYYVMELANGLCCESQVSEAWASISFLFSCIWMPIQVPQYQTHVKPKGRNEIEWLNTRWGRRKSMEQYSLGTTN